MRVKRPSRRLTIILLALTVLLVAVGLYVWQSALAWREYERRLSTEKAAYEQLQTKATTGTPTERLKAIRELDDEIAERGRLCDINGLYTWQASVVPALRDGVAACEAAVKRLDVLSSPLGALRDYLDTAEKLRGVVATLVSSEALTEKNWAELGVKRAEEVQASLRQLKTQDKDAKQLLDQAKGLSDQLVKAWQTLLSANEAKDKAAFLGASASVAKAYADFVGLADTADTDIAKKAEAVLKASTSTTRS
jgi:hypothetical protein